MYDEMEQFKLRVGSCFALISNQFGDTGRSHFLLDESSLAFNNVMITLTSARWSARIVELASGLQIRGNDYKLMFSFPNQRHILLVCETVLKSNQNIFLQADVYNLFYFPKA